MLRRKQEGGRREGIINSYHGRERRSGGRRSWDVGQMLFPLFLFVCFLKRDDMKAFYIPVSGEGKDVATEKMDGGKSKVPEEERAHQYLTREDGLKEERGPFWTLLPL